MAKGGERNGTEEKWSSEDVVRRGYAPEVCVGWAGERERAGERRRRRWMGGGEMEMLISHDWGLDGCGGAKYKCLRG